MNLKFLLGPQPQLRRLHCADPRRHGRRVRPPRVPPRDGLLGLYDFNSAQGNARLHGVLSLGAIAYSGTLSRNVFVCVCVCVCVYELGCVCVCVLDPRRHDRRVRPPRVPPCGGLLALYDFNSVKDSD